MNETVGFKRWFGVSKGSFKESSKYGVLLGIVAAVLALFNTFVFVWLGILEPVMLVENGTVTETLAEGANFTPGLFLGMIVVLAIISFTVTFAIVFIGLKKILQRFSKENRFYLAIYIFGVSLVVYFVVVSLIVFKFVKPHGLVLQIIAVLAAATITKAKVKEEPK
jgi:hypothetical protein